MLDRLYELFFPSAHFKRAVARQRARQDQEALNRVVADKRAAERRTALLNRWNEVTLYTESNPLHADVAAACGLRLIKFAEAGVLIRSQSGCSDGDEGGIRDTRYEDQFLTVEGHYSWSSPGGNTWAIKAHLKELKELVFDGRSSYGGKWDMRSFLPGPWITCIATHDPDTTMRDEQERQRVAAHQERLRIAEAERRTREERVRRYTP